jgi:hypothetical protein
LYATNTPPNTSEVTCNFSKLFVTFGLDILFSMLFSPTFRWVFVYEINNYPRLEFVKLVIFCYGGNDWYASNKDIFIGAISLYSGVAWSQGRSLPSIGVVIMLNCCFSKSICMFSTMIKFCITKKYIFKYYKPILWLRSNNLSSVYQLFYNFSCSYTYSFKW